MFYHLKRNIFIYYVVTTLLFIGSFWYATDIVKFNHFYILCAVVAVFVIISAAVISKLSTEPLEEYATNLEELSTNILHELNLPVAAIKTNTQMLQKEITTPKAAQRLKRIETSSNMIEAYYNELDYMITKQTKQERVDGIDLKAVIMQRIEFMQALYPYVKFTTLLESFWIKIDKIGLQKVIDNIIDNGIKYSRDVYQIDIKLQDGLLCIQDSGIGMDELALLKVLDRYYQRDVSMPGFGIGLSMVKRFCDENKIKLNIQSKKDNGTSLFLDFKGKKCIHQTL